MQYQRRTKTAEEYFNEFPEQPEEVGKIIGIPSFTTVYKVVLALKNNCIAMEDPRSALGKLHCIANTANLEPTGVAIPPSIDPGELSFAHLVLPQSRDTHLIWYTNRKHLWDSDNNLKEAAKKFLFLLIEPVYFQELAHELTKFKAVTVQQLLVHLTTRYPAELEEVQLMEATLQLEWNPENHIENLFQSVKEGVETLRQMDAISDAVMDKTRMKHVYLAIRNTTLFEQPCQRWRLLPAAQRATVLMSFTQ
jgi:hypothetical protein